MRILIRATTLIVSLLTPTIVSACGTGLYRSPDGREQAAIAEPAPGMLRYMMQDGRRGPVAAGSELSCVDGSIRSPSGAWGKVPLTLTETSFRSHGEMLSGVLIEPPSTGPRPLVVMVHGSERSSPRQSVYPYILASYGLSIFAYDKRGTGKSEGEYTQNFELLADDAAAALAEARKLAAGRFTRAGFFGGSQGGWVAPLAATRSPADFVAVGFGLIASPLEEDREQVASEMREKGYGPADVAQALVVADAAGAVVSSHFTSGFDQLRTVKRRYGDKPWLREIKGEFTGAVVQESEADLRRVGRALFDNLELIWDYNAVAAIQRVKVPQLWIIAEKDREAPPETSLARLSRLRDQGRDLAIYSFPDTDHGMIEFNQSGDGTRTYARITEGYFRLLTDWIKGRADGTYGRARKR